MSRSTLTPEEVDAIDPAFVDSVTADRLIETVRSARRACEMFAKHQGDLVHVKVALQCADIQGELAEAAEWAIGDVWCWLDADHIAKDPWAHDWRHFWHSRDIIAGKRADPCGICGAPSTTWSGSEDSRIAACSSRHWAAMHGRLPDEQCRLCNEVTVCAHELDGSPTCADCWPGERLLAERRKAWAARILGDDAEAER